MARDAIAMATQDLSNLYSLVSGKRVPYFPDLNSAMLAVSEEVRQLIDQVNSFSVYHNLCTNAIDATA